MDRSVDRAPSRILYLEDDEAISDLAILTLTELGSFEVEHHDTGTSALAAFQNTRPDLLLFDMVVPDMDGLETHRRIKTLPGGNNVPVIFMTARLLDDDRESYREAGAIGVIEKPFDPLGLSDQIIEIWRRKIAA